MLDQKLKPNDISDQDYQSLVHDFNSNDDTSFLGNLLHRLFEETAETFPNNVALIHDGVEVSYKELNASANLLARGLAHRALKHGDVVGLAVSRSIDLIVAMLAVLKLGAAYVPIDPSFPAKRIDQMVEDADCKFILLSDNSPDEVNLTRWKDICLSVGAARVDSITDRSNLGTHIDHLDVAYIIYTSGSTGRPKGIEISHGAAANYLLSLCKYEPGCKESDRMLAITTISFDMSTFEIYVPLFCGATIIIANTSSVRDPRELISLAQRHQVTILQVTPATWTMILESGWKGDPHISKIVTGGEPLSRHLADRLLSYADSVWNVYGPSESCYGSVARVGKGVVVVGNPVVNGRVYVLDENMCPVPMGQEGEVFIGGGSVSNGYRNKAELTASKFLSNPFHGGRFFRTGDLARFIAPGQLQVLGRADGMIKIRGNRIDVGDIESALVEHPDVSEAVVISRDDRLLAYCVVHVPSTTSSLDRLLRPWIAERLPPYMLPTFFIPMDKFPLSLNQKVDRKALPDPIEVIQSQSTARPTSELEHQIRAIWCEIVGHDQIGIEDNFFDIGGDSVRIIRMQVALEKVLHRTVPTQKLFEHYTIKALAAYLAGTDKEPIKRGSEIVSHDFTSTNEDIAIVSMACRLPGGVVTPEDLWQLLQSGGDAITDVPKDRWDAEKLYNVDPSVGGTSYCRKGGFLDSVYSYDASFFGISPREAQSMDPSQHLMLELCWEGFERAGYTKAHLSGTTTGIFLGISNNVTSNGNAPDLQGHSITGSAGATMSGRVSYSLNLQGPSLTVDTACSSSLVATHLACNALRQGECNMALAGGVSLLLTPGIHIEFSKLRGLSVDGRCKAFSDDTDGTGFSEGAAIVVLKRLSDAQRDGDEIHAVLRGTAVMHGGYSAGLTVPNGLGQEELFRTAIARSGLEPDNIDYIEAHGTATKLGDPIEATALGNVFGPGRASSDPLRLGSAKSNIGHTQAASGLVGLLKVVLSLQNNVLPRTLHVSVPTKAVDWKNSNMELVLANRPWLPSTYRLRRAGVSSFGIGGTNSHVIVQEFHGLTEQTEKTDNSTGQCAVPATTLFVLSGKSDAAIRAQAEKLRLHLESGAGKDNRLTDVAYSLATSRTHFHRRLAVTAKDKPQMLEKLASVSSGAGKLPNVNESGDATLAMLFTGQGSQYPGMGRDLYAVYPVFRDTLDTIATRFAELNFSLFEVMWPESQSGMDSLSKRTEFAQPALFALEVALWALWKSWGIEPASLLGHSVGELAVAHVSGILELPDACQLVLMRGRLMQAIPHSGKMASIQASSVEITAAIKELGLDDKVEIAGYNTPLQTVISGDVDSVDILMMDMAKDNRKTKALDTSHAFHSCHMNDMLDDFRAIAQTMRFSPAKIPIISSMTGRLAEAGELEQAEYWVQQARNAVRFSDAFQSLVKTGANVFIELGPDATLCGLGAACLADDSQMSSNAMWLPSLKPKMDASSLIQNNLGSLHVRNVSVDWAAYYKPFEWKRVSLPTYAFQRENFQPTSQGTWFNSVLPHAEDDEVVEGVEKMMFEMNWRTINTNELQLPLRGSWGFLCPGGVTTWTKETKEALSNTGLRLVPVTQPEDAEHMDGLLSLWDSDDTNDVVKMAHAFTAKGLAQLQDLIRIEFAVPVVWITRGAVGAGPADCPVHIGAGPLWGLMRTARSEHPKLHLCLIDVDVNNIEEDRARPLASALTLMLGDNQNEIAIRKEQLLMPHLERVSLDKSRPSPKPLLRTDGAVLITGGLGDLGGRIARRLVSAHGIRDLVLTSRRGMASPGAEALVAEFAKLGAKCTIVGGDIADLSSLRSVMQTFTVDRPLRGVVHAAGVLDSAILSSLTPQKCATTFGPKVDGLWNLHQLTKDNKHVDIFMMFSSIAGVMGLPGLGNYAAANSFLDVLAQLRHSEGLPATTVAYGKCGGEGMATTIVGPSGSHLSRLGLGIIAPDFVIEMWERAVSDGRALTVAAVLDLQRLKAYYGSQAGGVPPFLRDILGPVDVTTTVKVDRPVNLRDVLIDTPLEQQADVVLNTVQTTVAQALGWADSGDLDTSRPLQDFGIDSLSAVLIRNHLATTTELKLPANIALLYPNLKCLSDFLLSQLRAEGFGNGESDSSSASEDGTTTSPTTTASSVTLPAASQVKNAALRRGVLDPSIQFTNVSKDVTHHLEAPKTVFVTGATGFVGAFMVHEFLSRGTDVYCLVRASDAHQAQERMVVALKSYSLWKPEYEPLVKAVIGDLSQPLLGLGEVVFNDLVDRVDAIVHSGALVDWMRPLEEYVGPNIFGTHEVLRLASRGRPKAIHFISTISTLPIHLGYGLTEYDSEYGYGTSKYLAEKMVAAARFRGARASSYRFPYVAAATTNGHFRLDRGDFLNNLINGSLDLGAFPSIDADLSVVLPVDYLCSTIATIMTTDQQRVGEDYDFVNPRALTFDHFFEMMATASGAEANIPFSEWHRRALEYATLHPKSSLARISAVIDGYTDDTAGELMKGLPVGMHVFGREEYPAPVLDEEYVRGYLECIRSSKAKV